jgi:iron-sulfur cluster repair protein YtfE (RIC family)
VTATDARPDVREMVMVHQVFRRALTELPALVTATTDGDTARSAGLAEHLALVLTVLHLHHGGEDELLWPLLAQRCPHETALLTTMQAQHEAVSVGLARAEELLDAWRTSADAGTGAELARAIAALHTGLAAHLDEEERRILPLVPDNLSAAEWDRLRIHAMSNLTERQNSIFFGLMIESMPDAERAEFLAHLPPPVAAGWSGGGADAFATYISGVRG